MRLQRGTTRLAARLLSACAIFALLAVPVSADTVYVPDVEYLYVQLGRNPIGLNEELRITKLVESPEMSGLLVQVRGALPQHFHKLTQEIVYLVRGEGLLQRDSERIAIYAGAVVRIPAGQVHTFTNTGPEPAVFFVVTTPRWDERDRFMVNVP